MTQLPSMRSLFPFHSADGPTTSVSITMVQRVEAPFGNIKTRFLVLSDTHGLDNLQELAPLSDQHADVAIHCGDLTTGSQLHEFKASIRLLQSVDAPLKLVIAGNHDFSMDIPVFRKKVEDYQKSDDKDVFQAYGAYGEAKQLFSGTGITFLDEGTYTFLLRNGAVLTVYASPYTPSLGDWGFQYHPDHGHNFAITSDDGSNEVDVVITHGPPRGIFDYTHGHERAGCPFLFGAIARARPRMHCFGHIHEGWGAKLVTWRKPSNNIPTHLTDIDHEQSVPIARFSTLKEQAEHGLVDSIRNQCYTTSHCSGDPHPLRWGSQTLFVNAAIEGAFEDLDEGTPCIRKQPPWIIDLELPKASSQIH